MKFVWFTNTLGGKQAYNADHITTLESAGEWQEASPKPGQYETFELWKEADAKFDKENPQRQHCFISFNFWNVVEVKETVEEVIAICEAAAKS